MKLEKQKRAQYAKAVIKTNTASGTVYPQKCR